MDPNIIKVYDQLLPESLATNLANYFANTREWSFGHRSVKSPLTNSIPHWSIYFSKVDHENGTPKADISFDNADIQALFNLLYDKDVIPADAKLLRCYANGHTYGIDSKIHYDDLRPNTITVIYYPLQQWSVDWGGETIFWDRNNREIIKSVIPKNNRFVVFDAKMWHGARPLSRYADAALRVTLMFKFIY